MDVDYYEACHRRCADSKEVRAGTKYEIPLYQYLARPGCLQSAFNTSNAFGCTVVCSQIQPVWKQTSPKMRTMVELPISLNLSMKQ